MVEDVLKYHYYGGMLFQGLKQWKNALEMYSAVSAGKGFPPSFTPSALPLRYLLCLYPHVPFPPLAAVHCHSREQRMRHRG